jgi:hypothetical protein
MSLIQSFETVSRAYATSTGAVSMEIKQAGSVAVHVYVFGSLRMHGASPSLTLHQHCLYSGRYSSISMHGLKSSLSCN